MRLYQSVIFNANKYFNSWDEFDNSVEWEGGCVESVCLCLEYDRYDDFSVIYL